MSKLWGALGLASCIVSHAATNQPSLPISSLPTTTSAASNDLFIVNKWLGSAYGTRILNWSNLQNQITAFTNGLGSTNYALALVGALGTNSTNYALALLNALGTNSTNYAQTGLGALGTSVTNFVNTEVSLLPTTNYVQAITNECATLGYAQATTNGLATRAALTNWLTTAGFPAATSGVPTFLVGKAMQNTGTNTSWRLVGNDYSGLIAFCTTNSNSTTPGTNVFTVLFSQTMPANFDVVLTPASRYAAEYSPRFFVKHLANGWSLFTGSDRMPNFASADAWAFTYQVNFNSAAGSKEVEDATMGGGIAAKSLKSGAYTVDATNLVPALFGTNRFVVSGAPWGEVEGTYQSSAVNCWTNSKNTALSWCYITNNTASNWWSLIHYAYAEIYRCYDTELGGGFIYALGGATGAPVPSIYRGAASLMLTGIIPVDEAATFTGADPSVVWNFKTSGANSRTVATVGDVATPAAALNASALITGTVPLGRLPSSVATNNGDNTWSANQSGTANWTMDGFFKTSTTLPAFYLTDTTANADDWVLVNYDGLLAFKNVSNGAFGMTQGTNGQCTFTNGLFLPGTTTPPAAGGFGATLWSTGTNLCTVLLNSGGGKTTNSIPVILRGSGQLDYSGGTNLLSTVPSTYICTATYKDTSVSVPLTVSVFGANLMVTGEAGKNFHWIAISP